MGGGVSNEFYSDFKRVIKLIVKFLLALIAIAIVISVAYWTNSEFQQSSREKEVLNKALPFTKDHTPWVYKRTEFGSESQLALWFFGDTDRHAVIKVNGKYSVYSTSPGNGFIQFYKKAGDVCDYASAALDEAGKISWVSCDSDSYKDGPWNVVK